MEEQKNCTNCHYGYRRCPTGNPACDGKNKYKWSPILDIEQENISLKKENKKLKSALEDAYDYKKKYYEVKRYKRLSEKIKEMLRKLSPFENNSVFTCKFCRKTMMLHKDNCEYVILTKESEE